MTCKMNFREPLKAMRYMFGLSKQLGVRLIPYPCVVGMEGDAQRKSGFLGSFGPAVEDISFRADIHGVPLLVFAVPEVEIVVVVAKHKEIACASFLLIEFHQLVGCPVLCLEQREDFFEPHLGRMAVVFTVVIVFSVTFHIQLTGHPVAAAFHTLWSPMRPYAELCVAEPIWHLIVAEGFPCRLKTAGGHRFRVGCHTHFVALCLCCGKCQANGANLYDCSFHKDGVIYYLQFTICLNLSSEHHFVVLDDQSMKGVVHGNAAEVVGGA